jgi:hypothetical protein
MPAPFASLNHFGDVHVQQMIYLALSPTPASPSPYNWQQLASKRGFVALFSLAGVY